MDCLRQHADEIVKASLGAVLPDEAVRRALSTMERPKGRTYMVAIGKAAWQMAEAAAKSIDGIDGGIVITKYDHVKGEIPGVKCFEAGHPVPDKNGFDATRQVLDMVKELSEDDLVIFLISGGGSALFEYPLIPYEDLQDITRQLLASGADIVEMNTIRKRLSAVKGGKFADVCAPAKVYSIVLSDILGDPLDMIASGPAAPDTSTCAQAQAIVNKYGLNISEKVKECLAIETPKELKNVTSVVTGSVKELCAAAALKCKELGYETIILTDQLDCEASEAGRFLGAIAKSYTAGNDVNADSAESAKTSGLAFIAGGETVVHLKGNGLGGRNQELALAAAPYLNGMEAAVFSFGSDGTDGPTDAAGGYVDGETMGKFEAAGINVAKVLADNDAYHALKEVGGLIMTGPTGTNVNDAAVLLIQR